MKEVVLNTLMHLFAIVANANQEDVSNKGKKIINSFLDIFVSSKNRDEYYNLFINYLEFYRRERSFARLEENDNMHNIRQIQKVCESMLSDIAKRSE